MRRRISSFVGGACVVAVLLCAGGGALTGVGEASDGGPPAFVEWKDVCFPHEMHLGDLEIECKTCHHETNAAELRIPHDQYFEDLWIDCTTCHKRGAVPTTSMACSNCHHDSPTDLADETLSSKVVIHKSCWTCHEAGSGAAASKSCKSCHSNKHYHPTSRSGDRGSTSGGAAS